MLQKQYPYLVNTVTDNEKIIAEKKTFLQEVDNYLNRKLYVRIILLDWQERPIKEIQGELTGGSIAKDGSSAVRRSCNLSATLGKGEYNIDDGKMDFALNKKVYIEIGIKNLSEKYKDEYPILWFPQGMFFITNFSMNSSATSLVTINLTLHDKMGKLNGEIGGTYPVAMADLDKYTTVESDGTVVEKHLPIYNLIQEQVRHWGNEELSNIIIEDVDRQIKKVYCWSGITTSNKNIDVVSKDNGVYVINERAVEDESYWTGVDDDGNPAPNDLRYILIPANTQGITELIVLGKIFVEKSKHENGTLHVCNTTGRKETCIFTVMTNPEKGGGSTQHELIFDCEGYFTTPKEDHHLEEPHIFSYDGTQCGYMDHFDVGETIGYMIEDFYYDSELTMDAGQTVADTLEKIKQYLGNYEFFYDEFGVFHFRKIKDYAEKRESTYLLNKIDANNDYMLEMINTKNVYSFTDNTNMTSISVNPQYGNIKNDYVVLGMKKISSDKTKQIMYHVAIDDIPPTNNFYQDFIVYEDAEGYYRAAFPHFVKKLPEWGGLGFVYWPEGYMVKIADNSHTMQTWFKLSNRGNKWDGDEQVTYEADHVLIFEAHLEQQHQLSDPHIFDYDNGMNGYYLRDPDTPTGYRQIDAIEEYFLETDNRGQGGTAGHKIERFWDFHYNTDFNVLDGIAGGYVTRNWRTDIYLQALYAKQKGEELIKCYNTITPVEYYNTLVFSDACKTALLDTSYYGEELVNFWPMIYDIVQQDYWANIGYNGLYFLDLIDPSKTSLGEFSVGAIGRRTFVTKNDKINCLFAPPIPELIFLDGEAEDLEEQIKVCEEKFKLPYCILTQEQLKGLVQATTKYSGFEQIQNDLYLHTNHQKNININALPAYYLDVNSYTEMNDKTTNTKGNYMIKQINYQFSPESTMSVTANEAFSKI